MDKYTNTIFFVMQHVSFIKSIVYFTSIVLPRFPSKIWTHVPLEHFQYLSRFALLKLHNYQTDKKAN